MPRNRKSLPFRIVTVTLAATLFCPAWNAGAPGSASSRALAPWASSRILLTQDAPAKPAGDEDASALRELVLHLEATAPEPSLPAPVPAERGQAWKPVFEKIQKAAAPQIESNAPYSERQFRRDLDDLRSYLDANYRFYPAADPVTLEIARIAKGLERPGDRAPVYRVFSGARPEAFALDGAVYLSTAMIAQLNEDEDLLAALLARLILESQSPLQPPEALKKRTPLALYAWLATPQFEAWRTDLGSPRRLDAAGYDPWAFAQLIELLQPAPEPASAIKPLGTPDHGGLVHHRFRLASLPNAGKAHRKTADALKNLPLETGLLQELEALGQELDLKDETAMRRVAARTDEIAARFPWRALLVLQQQVTDTALYWDGLWFVCHRLCLSIEARVQESLPPGSAPLSDKERLWWTVFWLTEDVFKPLSLDWHTFTTELSARLTPLVGLEMKPSIDWSARFINTIASPGNLENLLALLARGRGMLAEDRAQTLLLLDPYSDGKFPWSLAAIHRHDWTLETLIPVMERTRALLVPAGLDARQASDISTWMALTLWRASEDKAAFSTQAAALARNENYLRDPLAALRGPEGRDFMQRTAARYRRILETSGADPQPADSAPEPARRPSEILRAYITDTLQRNWVAPLRKARADENLVAAATEAIESLFQPDAPEFRTLCMGLTDPSAVRPDGDRREQRAIELAIRHDGTLIGFPACTIRRSTTPVELYQAADFNRRTDIADLWRTWMWEQPRLAALVARDTLRQTDAARLTNLPSGFLDPARLSPAGARAVAMMGVMLLLQGQAQTSGEHARMLAETALTLQWIEAGYAELTPLDRTALLACVLTTVRNRERDWRDKPEAPGDDDFAALRLVSQAPLTRRLLQGYLARETDGSPLSDLRAIGRLARQGAVTSITLPAQTPFVPFLPESCMEMLAPSLDRAVDQLVRTDFAAASLSDLETLHTLAGVFYAPREADDLRALIQKRMLPRMTREQAFAWVRALAERRQLAPGTADVFQNIFVRDFESLGRMRETLDSASFAVKDTGELLLTFTPSLDYTFDYWLNEHFEALLRTSCESLENDLPLRALLARIWLRCMVSEQDASRLAPLSGRTGFVPYEDLVDHIYNLSPQKVDMLLERMLLSRHDGLLRTPAGRKALLDVLTARLSHESPFYPELESALAALLESLSPEMAYKPVAALLRPRMLARPANPAPLAQVARAVGPIDRFPKLKAPAVLEFLSMTTLPTTRLAAAYTRLQGRGQAKIEEAVGGRLPAQEVPGLLDPLDAALTLALQMGPAGERFLHLVSDSAALPPQARERFAAARETLRGQLKYAAMETLLHEAEDLAVRGDRRLLDFALRVTDFSPALETGSLATSYTATLADGSRYTVTVFNPEAQAYAQAAVDGALRAVALMQKNPPAQGTPAPVPVAALLKEARRWVEIENLEAADPAGRAAFARGHTYTQAGGPAVAVPASYETGSARVRIEADAAGWTLGGVLAAADTAPRMRAARTLVRGLFLDFYRQVSEPADAGRFLVNTNTGALAPRLGADARLHLAPGPHLVLDARQARIVRALLEGRGNPATAGELLDALWALPENAGLDRGAVETRLARRFGPAFFAGAKADEDRPGEVIAALLADGVRVPLEIALPVRNLAALRALARRAGLELPADLPPDPASLETAA